MDLSLLNLAGVLAAAAGGGLIARRLGYPAVLGELGAGILLGPPLLGLIQGGEALTVLGEVGVLLMMAFIGMELKFSDLKRASIGGVLAAFGGFVVPFGLCAGMMLWAGKSLLAALFVGAAAGVTSLATKSRILADLDLFDTRVAHVLIAGALLADTLCLVVFAGLLGFDEVGGLPLGEIALMSMMVGVFFTLSLLIGAWVMPALLRFAGDLERFTPSERFFGAVVFVLLFAEGAHLAGLHGILGAFVAGLILRSLGIGIEIERDLTERIRKVSLGMLAPIFFVTAGFAVSLSTVREAGGLLVAIIVLATLGKILGTALFYLPTGKGWREGLTIGAGMNGRGAVEIIVAQIGLSAGIIDVEVFSILVVMAIATTATVPVLLGAAVRWLDGRGELVRVLDDRDTVIVVGAGSIGKAVASAIGDQRPVVLIDTNPERCAEAIDAGFDAHCVNALDPEALEALGARQASHLVALTANHDVNALALHLGGVGFRIPNLVVAADGSRAHERLLDSLGARMLFGDVVDLETLNEVAAESGELVEIERLADGRWALDADDLVLSAHRHGRWIPFTGFASLGSVDRLRALRPIQPLVDELTLAS